jgi:rhodanese-related sulfurtransferase
MSKKKKNFDKKLKQTPRDIFLGSIITIFAICILAIGLFFIFFQSNSSSAAQIPSEIGAADAFELYQTGTVILDVREKSEWKEFHIPNSIHIPLGDLEKRAKELPKNKEIIVICRSGNRSLEGRNILLQKGFDSVTSVAGGIKSWQAAGYPVISGE